jgi:hypothetical protein
MLATTWVAPQQLSSSVGVPTSAPGLGAPLPHLHRDCTHARENGVASPCVFSAPMGTGSQRGSAVLGRAADERCRRYRAQLKGATNAAVPLATNSGARQDAIIIKLESPLGRSAAAYLLGLELAQLAPRGLGAVRVGVALSLPAAVRRRVQHAADAPRPRRQRGANARRRSAPSRIGP